jgi:hypothetical protein
MVECYNMLVMELASRRRPKPYPAEDSSLWLLLLLCI